MKKKKYTISDKVKANYQSQMNMNKRIKVFTLMKAGVPSKEVAAKFNCSRQSIEEMYKKIKDMTFEELENLSNLVLAKKE